MLVYGSTAIKFWYPDFSRNPKDIDYITPNKKKNTKEKEYYWIDSFQYILDNNKHSIYVEPDFLYTIKVSHLSWNINWTKHMKDTIFLKNKGCKLDKVLYEMLYKEWEIIHGKKNVKMNVKNEEFFKNNIKRKFEHDWLHEQFAFYERPLNEKIRKDLNSPLCSKELWNKLSFEDKILTALEELFVLTSERFIFIKNPIPYKYAINKTLQNMIVSTTKGWFNLFLIENFEELRTSKHSHFFNVINKISSKK